MTESNALTEQARISLLAQIVALNRDEETHETDSFREHRYRQFARRLSNQTCDVLDVGCSAGRGGAVLKALLPGLRITGFDCLFITDKTCGAYGKFYPYGLQTDNPENSRNRTIDRTRR
jgi:hypothetical protein